MHEVLDCSRIELAYLTTGAEPDIDARTVISVTNATMNRLHLKSGYTVMLESVTSTDSSVSVRATVRVTTSVPDGGCALSHAASFALTVNGRSPEKVAIVAVVANDALVANFHAARELLDKSIIDTRTIAQARIRLDATFWLLGIIMATPARISSMRTSFCDQPIVFVVAAFLCAIVTAGCVQACWALKRGACLYGLPTFERLQRRWETSYGNDNDAVFTTLTATALGTECRAITDINAWAVRVGAVRKSVWCSCAIVG
jgi:hypothetical protein